MTVIEKLVTTFVCDECACEWQDINYNSNDIKNQTRYKDRSIMASPISCPNCKTYRWNKSGKSIAPVILKDDNLKKIFKEHAQYNEKYIHDVFYKRYDTKEKRISVLCTALIHEAVELQRLTDWKWWKNFVEMNKTEACEELIDIFHFIIQIAEELGMDDEQFTRTFFRKLKINIKRQQNGY